MLDRLGPPNLVAPALGLYAAAALIASHAETAGAWQLAGLMAGLAHGTCFPVLSSTVIARTPDTARGKGMAGFTGLWEVAALLATPALGAIADDLGDASMFATAALITPIVLIPWLFLEHRQAGRAPERTRDQEPSGEA